MDPRKLRITLAAVFLVLIVFLLFKPVLTFGFVNWDDDISVVDNPLIRSLDLENIRKIFTTRVNTGYSPLVVLSHAVEYHFFKLDPFVYHLNNLLLHLSVVGLVFWFFLNLKIGWQAAFVAALVFGIHPLRAESVAWVAERKDGLYAFFYMLSLNCYLRYLDTRQKKFYFWTVILGSLSMFSKLMAITLPLVLFLCDWYRGRVIDRKAVSEKIIFFLLAVPIGLFATALYHDVPGGDLFQEALVVLWSFAFYIEKFFFPVTLGIMYELPRPVSITNGAYASAVLVCVLWAFALFRLRRHKIFVFASAFYLISISIVLRVKYNFSPGGELFYAFADRFMYLPSLGFCLLIGLGVVKLMSVYKNTDIRTVLACVLVAASIVLLSFKSYVQIHNWKDSLSLWDYVLDGDPTSALAYNNRGTLRDDLQEAVADFNKCLVFDPYFAEAYFNRAQAYFKLGNYEQSIMDYTRYLEFDPKDAQTYFLRSRAHDLRGDEASASEDILRAKALGYQL